MATPSAVAASRLRYRLSKPKPNIDAGKRVTTASGNAISSAVNGQRGPSSGNTAAAPLTPLNTLHTSSDSSKEGNQNAEVTDTATQIRPSSPVPVAVAIESDGTELATANPEPTPTKQVTLAVSPRKPSVPPTCTNGPTNRENAEDSAKSVSFNLPQQPKQRERKVSVRGGNEGRDKEESTRHRYKKGPNPPERTKMTMLDLIYWNPENNPMVQEDLPGPINDSNEVVDSAHQRLEEEAVDDPDYDDDQSILDKTQESETASLANDDEDSMPVPQVKIGPDGNIVLDEQSLVIQTSAAKKGIGSAVDVHERSSIVTYNSFRKRKSSKTWSDQETSKFYMALSTVGTDFSMMQNLFPKRDRHELKLKYKREEKYNKALVDRAILEQQQYDLTLFEESKSENEDPEVANKKVTKRKRAVSKEVNKKKGNVGKGRRKRTCRFQEESDTEDDESEKHSTIPSKEVSENGDECVVIQEMTENVETTNTLIELTALPVAEDDNTKKDDNSNEEDDEVTLDNVLKQTRSGRQPKKRVPFTMDDSVHKRRKKIDYVTQPENEKVKNMAAPVDVIIDKLIIDFSSSEPAESTNAVVDLEPSDVEIVYCESLDSMNTVSVNDTN